MTAVSTCMNTWCIYNKINQCTRDSVNLDFTGECCDCEEDEEDEVEPDEIFN